MAVIVLVVIGIVLLWPKIISSIDHPQQPKVQHRKQANHTFFSILLTTSTHSMPQHGKEKRVCTSFSQCRRNKPEWSVKVEACTKNIGSPYKVIKEWQFSERKKQNMLQKYDLHKNGSFFINEIGYYRIYIKVTFQNLKNGYLVESTDTKIKFDKKNCSVDGNQVIVHQFCGDITEKLSFILKLSNISLVYLFPDKTYFTVEKMK